MIVVADTSPINYLIQIEQESLLQRLYSRLILPDAVLLELRASRAPEAVREWARRLPDWVDVTNPKQTLRPELTQLDPGERAALQIALELGADRVLIDERAGYTVGVRLGLVVTGTLGVLRDGHRSGMVDGRKAYLRLLTTTNFRVSPHVGDIYLTSL